MATDLQVLNSECRTVERNSPAGFDKKRVEEVIAEGSLNFDEWTSLISEIENSFPDDIEILGLVYDSFFVEFPLCYGYWRKYADHKARLCAIDEVVEVYERAVESATYSVDMWFQYCSFSMSAFEDPDDIRRLFKRGLSFVGKDYLCHTLWDKYIEFEFSQQQWSSLAQIYVQALRFPSKKLHWYHASFKKLAASWKEELERQSDSGMELQSELALESEVPMYYKDDEISSVVKDMLDPSLGLARSKSLQKYLFVGEQIYKEACQLDEKINYFENRISRPYFHVKPLNDSQLKNWNDYLDFAEEKGDFDWVVKLYERCLIPCAYYPEFWMRYVDYMESKGGREIANYALARATQTFLKRVPVIHVFSARYKEQIGDIYAARAAFLKNNMDSDSSFIENLAIKANMEKRLGNFVAACNIYKEALETAAERKKLHTLPMLYVNFSRLTYMTTDSADAARDILIDGINHIPSSKLLIEELIKFTMMHGGSRHINAVEAVIAKALYSGPDVLKVFSLQDVEDISSLYLQFVDLCGTIGDVRTAWNRHIRFFAHSMRIGYECPARETKSLRTDMEGQQESIAALPPQPSGSEHLVQSPSKDRTLSPPEKYDCQSDRPSASLQSNQQSPSPENQDIQSDSTAIDLLHSEEADSNSQEMMLQIPPKVMEQDGVDACEPKVLSIEVVHQVANENEAVQASEEFSKEDVQQDYDPDSKQDLKPLSLEGLSISPGNNDFPDSVCATSHGGEAPEETGQSHESMMKIEAPQEDSLSDGSMLEVGENTNGSHFASSSMGPQASGSAPIQTGTVSPSYLGSHQNFMPEAHSRLQMPANGGRNWHQKHNPDRIHRDSRFGFRGHSHRRQYQQQRTSSQRYPRAETGAHMPMNPGYPSQPMPSANPQVQQCSQAQSQFPPSANLTAPQAWPMQNVQQQNFASACHSHPAAQPVFNTQEQMSPYPTQCSEQHGLLQNNLAYNQMWQYYYYQQQQFFLQQQQQQMQQQQHLQQQSNQEQQYQQQQYLQQQQQQLQAMQQQQQSQYQQQLLQQQRLLYSQHHQVEQHHLQQQEKQLPQQQQQEQEQEQRKSEQKITTSWNNNCFQQDQGTAPCHNTGAFVMATSAASPSPHIQQQSPQR